MCGIVGFINKDARSHIDPQSIESAADLLSKRGPDDHGIWVGDGSVFGHRRLSVIDTSPAGHQPMESPDGRYILVFNGEIYNYQELRVDIGDSYSWQGHSDSEVVLAAYICWGANCVERFHGMFAFSIWDTKSRILFAARDRLGVKPFYYYSSKDVFAFASRPRVLHVLLGRDMLVPDSQALRYYLEGGYIPAPYSLHETIRKLPSAHYLHCSEGGLHIKRYWGFKQILPEKDWERRSENDLLDELEEIITRCVRSRMISDVPLGAFLSGGIDSSLIVAMMSKYSSVPVKTFTIGFREKQYDESPNARAVADYLGTDHHFEKLSVDDLLELMPIYSKEFDEPFFDSSAFPVMAVSRLARKHVAVSLSGDGGDELFGGYHYYEMAMKMDSFYRLPSILRNITSRVFGVVPNHQSKLLSGLLGQSNPATSFAFSRGIAKDFTSVLNQDVIEDTGSYLDLLSENAAQMPQCLNTAEVGMRLDTKYTLSDDYLQKVDVGSMSFSLESREPLLDQELIEWAMKLPLKWKIRNGSNKYLLRKLAYRYLSRELLERPKQGFSVPIDGWLRGKLKEWALERIHDSRFYTYMPIDKSRVIELFKLHDSRRRNVHPLLWAVLMLIEYCYQHESI